MSVKSFEAIVENGQIRLPKDVQLPSLTKVYVIVPGAVESTTRVSVPSPKLARSEQAKDFDKTVIPDAEVR